jgi:hypothetical protein
MPTTSASGRTKTATPRTAAPIANHTPEITADFVKTVFNDFCRRYVS